MPRVTVILATYNRSYTLRCALLSLCNQTYRDFEAWIVGDSCTDDSEQAVANLGDERLHWTNLPQRVGSQSGPNNEGLRRATGDLIAYLGHDDLWFPWHLESLIATTERTGADFVYSMLVLTNPNGTSEGMGAPVGRRSEGDRFVPPSGWLHRRSMIDRCGLWPLPGNLTGSVDHVFQQRAFSAGCRFAASGQLSVIKFPSLEWRLYARSGDFPQPEYLERMQRDPREVRDWILTQLTATTTRQREDMNLWPALRYLLKAVYWRVAEWYGVNRWPLSAHFRWRQRRIIRRRDRLRGLSPTDAVLAGEPGERVVG